MKKSNYILFGIIAVLLIFSGYGCNSYNSLVDLDTDVEKSWSNVEAQYQRRADLIEKLAKVVVKAAKTEENILKEVVEARASATGVKIDPSNLSQEQLAAFDEQQAQLNSKLNSSLSKLMVVVEKYPDLKSIPQFAQLNDEISGSENRISTARTDFNEAVAKYNKKVRRFPSNIVASMFGFEKRDGFKSKSGSENAPELKIMD
jgi:LemA protein